MINNDKAVKILDEACKPFIKGQYEIGFAEDDEGTAIIYLATHDGDAYTWDLKEPKLTEVLLHLDAHSFCAWVLRNTPQKK